MITESLTTRLILRTARIEDICDSYINALNDYSIVRLTEARHSTWSREKIEEFINSQREKESEIIGIFKQADKKYIGNIRLSLFSDLHKRLELGILIFDKLEWNKGFATEALLGIENYIFKDLGYNKICADYYSINSGSAKMFSNANYLVQGKFDKHFLLEGQWIDSIRVAKFSML